MIKEYQINQFGRYKNGQPGAGNLSRRIGTSNQEPILLKMLA